ncbi:MAG: hypothetical protein ACMXYG_04235 [Candidatus Woesearchaeota archaeon]
MALDDKLDDNYYEISIVDIADAYLRRSQKEKLKIQDYETFLGEFVLILRDKMISFYRSKQYISPHELDFRIEMSASYDSGIKAHFDAYVYMQKADGGEVSLGRATAYTDTFQNFADLRMGFIEALRKAGGSILYQKDDENYLVVLREEFTMTNSAAIVASLGIRL